MQFHTHLHRAGISESHILPQRRTRNPPTCAPILQPNPPCHRPRKYTLNRLVFSAETWEVLDILSSTQLDMTFWRELLTCGFALWRHKRHMVRRCCEEVGQKQVNCDVDILCQRRRIGIGGPPLHPREILVRLRGTNSSRRLLGWGTIYLRTLKQPATEVI